MLYSCLDLLATQDEYCRAVHEHHVLWLTKEQLACEYVAEEVESYEYDPSDITGCEIPSYIDAALEKTWVWVEGSYVRKGKLTAGEAEAMQKAITEFCFHAAQGQCKGPTAYLHFDALHGESCKKLLKIFENIRTRFKLELRKLVSDI